MAIRADRTDNWLREEIQKARPGYLTWQLFCSAILLPMMLFAVVKVWESTRPHSVVGGSLMLMGSIATLAVTCLFSYLIATSDHNGFFGQFGFLADWKERAWIGMDSVWMLEYVEKVSFLCMRIERRDWRQPHENKGSWVLCVPLGGWFATPSLRYGKTGNPHLSITVSDVRWDSRSIVQSVVISDRDGNAVRVGSFDLLEMMREESSLNNRSDAVEHLIWALNDARSTSERHRCEYQEMYGETSERLKNSHENYAHLNGELSRERQRANQMASSLEFWRPRIGNTVEELLMFSSIAAEGHSMVTDIRNHIAKEVSRLRQKAPKETEKLSSMVNFFHQQLDGRIKKARQSVGLGIHPNDIDLIGARNK